MIGFFWSASRISPIGPAFLAIARWIVALLPSLAMVATFTRRTSWGATFSTASAFISASAELTAERSDATLGCPLPACALLTVLRMTAIVATLAAIPSNFLLNFIVPPGGVRDRQ